LRAGGPADPSQIWFCNKSKLGDKSPKEAAMTRSKLSTKAVLLTGAIGLSTAVFAGSQPAAAQSYSDEYSCPAGSVYDLTYGCTLPGATYDTYGAYGTYGSYAPYGGYGSYYGGHREFGRGHGMGGGFNHGAGFVHTGGGDFSHGMADGFNHGVGFAHASGGFAHGIGGGFDHGVGLVHAGGFGHGMAGGFHGGGGGRR
jgi:hypothetical protein